MAACKLNLKQIAQVLVTQQSHSIFHILLILIPSTQNITCTTQLSGACDPLAARVVFVILYLLFTTTSRLSQFAVADAEGSVCLWQVGLGLNMNKPYMVSEIYS